MLILLKQYLYVEQVLLISPLELLQQFTIRIWYVLSKNRDAQIHTMMSKVKKMLLISLLGLSSIAQADSYTFIGNLANYNDVVKINFSLAQAASNIRVWTDSFMNGDNFDPIVGLWNGATGAKIAENDDNNTIGPSQTSFDSGFKLTSLAIGDYFLTVASFPNFSKGENFSDGFNGDSSESAPTTDSKTAYRVNVDGVELTTDEAPPSSVPLPKALWLFGSAIFVFAGFSSRRSI